MSDAMPEDITSDFVNELKDYIPLMRDKTKKLAGRTPETSGVDLAELHRLVHAIRGASALLKLNKLSEVASDFEAVVEKMISGHFASDRSALRAANKAIDYFDVYSQQTPCNDAFNMKFRAECIDALRDILKLAPSDNEQDFLSQLLKSAEEAEFHDVDTALDSLKGPSELSWSDAQEESKNTPDPIDLAHQELLEDFYQEAEDHFHDLGQAIGQLRQQISSPTTMSPDDKELLRLIRRSVHTIKGAAAVLKLKPIASWGHEFENVLDWLYQDAGLVSPDAVKIIAEAADMLECFVTAPQKADPRQTDRLRTAFQEIVDSERDVENIAANQAPTETTRPPAECVEIVLNEEDTIDSDSHSVASAPTRPIRVNFDKIKNLVNLSGELTIANSAFDQGIDGLGNLIAEIDQTQSRLKKIARDLEVGYEHKAIGRLGTADTYIGNTAIAVGEETPAYSEFDPIELDRYSELNLIIRSLSETAADAGTISQQLANTYIGFKGYLHHLRLLLGELNEKTMRMRMTPMTSISNRLRRTVRETASQLNKKVHLTLQGEDIELDKTVWDKLADPLMHLLRNAVDHGVEPQEMRKVGGKPEIATIQLAAAQKGNRVILHISDDGAGLDYGAIRRTVVSVESGRDIETIPQEELAELIFEPGFSTRQTVSEVSGRGVGLDVVKESIIGLKGSVHVEKSESTGTTFCINLPLTMAVTKALIFDVDGEQFAAPLYDIKEVLRVKPDDLVPQGDNTIYISGRRLLYYKLSEILTGSDMAAPPDDKEPWPLILIVEKASWKAAVAISRIHSQRDIVLKGLGTHLSYVKGISGATIMGDGKVVPILDLEGLLNDQSEQHHPTLRIKPPEVGQKPLEIMVVDDSVTIRNVVSRLMQRQGWEVITAKDGVEAIEVLQTRRPDLIILDIEMPRMNGYEFLSQIRNKAELADLPVIMHTSRASKKHRNKAEALGANGFVTKPYEEEDLIDQVKDLSRNN